MVASGDPVAVALDAQWEIVMPNFRLDDREIDDLINYMAGETTRIEQRYAAAVEEKEHDMHDHSSHHHGEH
jgi:hypothetical protein